MNKKINESSELVDLLRRAIISGDLKPRERLVETTLAEKYNVSRTPVREAIKHLEALGLVKLERYKGAIVADVNPNKIREMQIVRANLEGLAASLAATKLTDNELSLLEKFDKEMEIAAKERNIQKFSTNNGNFHQLFYLASGNKFLYESIIALLENSWHEPSSSWQGLGNIAQTIVGHRKILRALKERNPEKARISAEQHILDAVAIQDRLYKSQNESDSPIFSIYFRED